MDKFIDLAVINRTHPLFPKEEKKNGKMHGVLNPENNVVIALRTLERAQKLQRRWRVLHGRDMLTGMLPSTVFFKQETNSSVQASKTLEVLAAFADDRREHEELYAPGMLVIVPESEFTDQGKGWLAVAEDEADAFGVYDGVSLVVRLPSMEEAQGFVDDNTGAE